MHANGGLQLRRLQQGNASGKTGSIVYFAQRQLRAAQVSWGQTLKWPSGLLCQLPPATDIPQRDWRLIIPARWDWLDYVIVEDGRDVRRLAGRHASIRSLETRPAGARQLSIRPKPAQSGGVPPWNNWNNHTAWLFMLQDRTENSNAFENDVGCTRIHRCNGPWNLSADSGSRCVRGSRRRGH
jgi:hypothetical protein